MKSWRIALFDGALIDITGTFAMKEHYVCRCENFAGAADFKSILNQL